MTNFFSCDWGTTSFRLRCVNATTGQVLAERREASGAKTLSSTCAPTDTVGREKIFAAFLREQLRLLVGDDPAVLEGASVIISGMASSSVGWRELPYANVPVGLDGSSLAHDTFALDLCDERRINVHLVSGLCTENDIMRGEETEIIGLFAHGQYAAVAANGIVVLPGTHSKHVHLRDRKLIDFCTYMTGELFDVLSAHSLLRASVQPMEQIPPRPLTDAIAQAAFEEGVRACAVKGLAAGLFQTRVRTVLRDVPPVINRWFLSGLLIAAELLDLANLEGDPRILLAAAEPLNMAYRLAFETLGLHKRISLVPAAEMALASVRGHHTLLQHLAK